jgi:glyoxylase-like metal-dependent hydrolase (beta-lactamase superfamily II)
VLFVGKTDAVLVDGLVAAQAEPLVQKVASITQLPVNLVINTHYHGDHTGANAVFRKLGASVIATEDAARTMARATPNARGTMNAALPEAARPTETFAGTRTVKAAGKTFKMTEMAPSHTDGDAVVFIPEVNVLVMGDLHHSNEYPVYDSVAGCQCGSYEGNLEVDRAVLKMGNEKTVIVPGHGGVTNKAELRAYISMLEKVRTDINAMILAGKSADEVVAAQLLANDKSPQPGGPDNRDSFIRVLYDALKTGRGN